MKKHFIPYFSEKTVDDLMRKSYESLLNYGISTYPTKGESLELSGVTLELLNPLARISQSATRGKIFSALGELSWYLSGSDNAKFMSYYVKDYEINADDPASENPVVNGAYGPRIFSPLPQNQFQVVRDILFNKQDSRQAVIQIFDSKDIHEKHKDIPCTCVLQFMKRQNRLDLIVYMRSNDIFLGFPHDIFSFTMIQEIMSRSLNVEMGVYKHIVGSLHLYKTDIDRGKQFLEEGWHSRENSMPKMPFGDPWASISKFLAAEKDLREGREINWKFFQQDSYWDDLVRILQAWRYHNEKDKENIDEIAKSISSFYVPYLMPKT